MTNTFSIEEALGRGWALFKENWLLLIGALLITGVIQGVCSGIASAVGKQPVLSLIAQLAAEAVGLALYGGLARITLALVDGRTPSMELLFSAFPLIVNLFVAGVLTGILVGIGFVLLIVPGIFLATRLAFATFFIVDEGAGPIEAIQRSWDMTRGHFWQLFLFGIVVVILNCLGLLILLVGVLATGAVTLVATAFIYRRLSGTEAVTTSPYTSIPPQWAPGNS